MIQTPLDLSGSSGSIKTNTDNNDPDDPDFTRLEPNAETPINTERSRLTKRSRPDWEEMDKNEKI